MLKISSIIPSESVSAAVEVFLVENDLGCWLIEKDTISGESFLYGYVEDRVTGEKDFSRIHNEFKELSITNITKIDPLDWVNEYKKFAKPWQCEDLHWVPQCMKNEVELPDNAIVVHIDPGMAFGSGLHETTQLCANALVMFRSLYEKTDDLMLKSCIDIGCGSGILGISALKLGLSHVTFLDIDDNAIRISRENAESNGLFSDQIDFVIGDLKVGLLGRQADLLLVNILSNVLIENADLLVNSVKSGGLLCLSGILKSEAIQVSKVFKKLAQDTWDSFLENELEEGEWSLLVYFRG